jgi:maleate isomerase
LIRKPHFLSQSRRLFLQNCPKAGVALAAFSAIFCSGIGVAAASNWRGLVGCVKATTHSDSLEDLFSVLPAGVGLLPVYMNFSKGTKAEMQDSMANYETNVAYLASQQCDLISVEGAPAFMLMGREKEAALVDGWQKKYNIPMFTAPQNQVNAMHALKAKKVLGITPFGVDMNKIYTQYLSSAGFDILSMNGMENITFSKIQDVPSEQIYGFIKKAYLKNQGADVIYILGSALSALGIIDALEQDLQVPVLSPICARAWEIQKRLHIHQPIKGYGKLLATLPA